MTDTDRSRAEAQRDIAVALARKHVISEKLDGVSCYECHRSWPVGGKESHASDCAFARIAEIEATALKPPQSATQPSAWASGIVEEAYRRGKDRAEVIGQERGYATSTIEHLIEEFRFDELRLAIDAAWRSSIEAAAQLVEGGVVSRRDMAVAIRAIADKAGTR